MLIAYQQIYLYTHKKGHLTPPPFPFEKRSNKIYFPSESSKLIPEPERVWQSASLLLLIPEKMNNLFIHIHFYLRMNKILFINFHLKIRAGCILSINFTYLRKNQGKAISIEYQKHMLMYYIFFSIFIYVITNVIGHMDNSNPVPS